MKSKNIELSFKEILLLEAELNGLKDNTGKKTTHGILEEKISIKAKYWLGRLNDVVLSESKKISEYRNEIIKKYAEKQADGSYGVPRAIQVDGKAVVNPKLIEFSNEQNDFLNQKISIEYMPVNLELLENMESNNHYPLVHKFLEIPVLN